MKKKILVLVLAMMLLVSVSSFTYAETTNKIVSLYTSKGTKVTDQTYAFSTTDMFIYGNVKFEKPATEEVTGIFYYIRNGQREVFTGDILTPGKQSYSFKTIPAYPGNWEFEVISGNYQETITFTVAKGKVTKPINVYIDGIQKVYDVSPKVINGSTLVPMRGIFEDLNAEIDWNAVTKTVTAVSDDTTIKLTIDNENALINDKQVKLDQKPQIINGSTMVPLRFVSESLGATVKWDGTARSVYITTN